MAYVRCWTCVGNGVIVYPGAPVVRCRDCDGTGCDAAKTRASPSILEGEKSYSRQQFGPNPNEKGLVRAV